MKNSWIPVACAALLLTAAAGADAQGARQLFKCRDAQGKTVYTEKACDDPDSGKVVGEKKPKGTDQRQLTPAEQKRADAANRAKLSPAARKECDELAATIRKEEEALKARPSATPTDEATLVNSRIRAKQLRCVLR